MKGSKTHSNRPVHRINNGKKKTKARKPEQNKHAEKDKERIADARDAQILDKWMAKVSVQSSGHDSEPTMAAALNENIEEQEDVAAGTNRNDEEHEMQKQIDAERRAIIKEIKHVRKRIRNIQESIQLSVNIAQPRVWEENSLNAVVNCVNEWRSIVAFHGIPRQPDIGDGDDNGHGHDVDPSTHPFVEEEEASSQQADRGTIPPMEEHPMHPDNEWSKSTSLEVYNLIQMAIQTGPLKGGKPGYFKRCGVDVAKMARTFLVRCICIQPQKDQHKEGNDEAAEAEPEPEGGVPTMMSVESVLSKLRFTVKQKDSLEKWINNADRAIAANKGPSKSALKHQKSVNTKGMSRRDKRRKGALIKGK